MATLQQLLGNDPIYEGAPFIRAGFVWLRLLLQMVPTVVIAPPCGSFPTDVGKESKLAWISPPGRDGFSPP